MERSTSGFVERYSSSLPQEDVKGFGEFLHEWNPQTVPKVRSYEEDERLKIPPPDFVLGPEHWLGLHADIRKNLWQAYRLRSIQSSLRKKSNP